MDRKAEVNYLLSLCTTYKKDWRQHNCPAVCGDREPLENAWKKLTKNSPEHRRDVLMKKVESAMGKQTAFRGQERAAGEFVPQPIVMSRWMNEKRFDREIVLQGDKSKPKSTGLCSCGAEVNVNINMNGEPTGKCWPCHDKLRATG